MKYEKIYLDHPASRMSAAWEKSKASAGNRSVYSETTAKFTRELIKKKKEKKISRCCPSTVCVCAAADY